MYGGKFAFQNRLSWLVVGRKFTILLCFALYSRTNSKFKPPGGLIFGGAISGRVFCVTILGGLYIERLIFGILRYSDRKKY